jgi:hypothetical protein
MVDVAVINDASGRPYFRIVFAGSVYVVGAGDRVTDPNTTLSIMVIVLMSLPSIDNVFKPATVAMFVIIVFVHASL